MKRQKETKQTKMEKDKKELIKWMIRLLVGFSALNSHMGNTFICVGIPILKKTKVSGRQ